VTFWDRSSANDSRADVSDTTERDEELCRRNDRALLIVVVVLNKRWG